MATTERNQEDMANDEVWNNSWRDQEGGYGGPAGFSHRRGRRHDRDGGDTSLNLRVTVVADNGNLCVFHKVMADGDAKPVGIPVNRISTISVSQTDSSTLIITSEGTVCVSESFEDAMRIYAAARPMVVPPAC